MGMHVGSRGEGEGKEINSCINPHITVFPAITTTITKSRSGLGGPLQSGSGLGTQVSLKPLLQTVR